MMDGLAEQIQHRIDEHYNEWSRFSFVTSGQYGNVQERKHLPYRDIQELNNVQYLGARLFHESVLGRTIHENLLSYVVGTGHSYTVKAQPNANPSESDIKRAQAVVDAMLTYHDWPCVQEETYNRRFRSGDNIDRLVPIGGIVDVIRIEPHELQAERDAPFGVKYQDGDVRNPETFFVATGNNAKAKPEKAWDRQSVICHGKRGVDLNDPRGVPLLFPAYCPTRTIDELFHGLGKVLGSVFDHIVVYNHLSTSTNQKIAQVAYGLSSAREEQANKGQFGNPGGITHARDYTVELHGDALNAQAIVQAFSALTRRIGVLTGLPEFIITGDADTGSRNSLLSAEGPTTRRIAREASSGARYEIKILYHAIAATFGKFGDPKYFDQLRQTFLIEAKPPLAESQDKAAETRRILDAMRERVYSPQHACQLLGVNHEQILTEWEQWEERLAKGREALGRIIAVKPEDVEKMAAAASAMIAAGVDPTEALTKVGLDPVEHIELVKPHAGDVGSSTSDNPQEKGSKSNDQAGFKGTRRRG